MSVNEIDVNAVNERTRNKVTRVEVIHRGIGRLFTDYNVDDAWVDFQDDGRTIKVFINEPG